MGFGLGAGGSATAGENPWAASVALPTDPYPGRDAADVRWIPHPNSQIWNYRFMAQHPPAVPSSTSIWMTRGYTCALLCGGFIRTKTPRFCFQGPSSTSSWKA